jgi:hypothetical protein
VLGVEHGSIDYANSSAGILTPNIVVSTLALMSLNEIYRMVVPEERMEDSRVWYLKILKIKGITFIPCLRRSDKEEPPVEHQP